MLTEPFQGVSSGLFLFGQFSCIIFSVLVLVLLWCSLQGLTVCMFCLLRPPPFSRLSLLVFSRYVIFTFLVGFSGFSAPYEFSYQSILPLDFVIYSSFQMLLSFSSLSSPRLFSTCHFSLSPPLCLSVSVSWVHFCFSLAFLVLLSHIRRCLSECFRSFSASGSFLGGGLLLGLCNCSVLPQPPFVHPMPDPWSHSALFCLSSKVQVVRGLQVSVLTVMGDSWSRLASPCSFSPSGAFPQAPKAVSCSSCTVTFSTVCHTWVPALLCSPFLVARSWPC